MAGVIYNIESESAKKATIQSQIKITFYVWFEFSWIRCYLKAYRVRQLILMHFRRTFFHDLMTLYSKVNDFWDPEIGRFDMKHYFFTSLTSHGLHDLRKKRYKIFEEMWAWGLHGYTMRKNLPKTLDQLIFCKYTLVFSKCSQIY